MVSLHLCPALQQAQRQVVAEVSFAPVQDQQALVPAGKEFLGTWVYGDEFETYPYHISRGQDGKLRFDQQLPSDEKVFGQLRPDGSWLQAELAFSLTLQPLRASSQAWPQQ